MLIYGEGDQNGRNRLKLTEIKIVEMEAYGEGYSNKIFIKLIFPFAIGCLVSLN